MKKNMFSVLLLGAIMVMTTVCDKNEKDSTVIIYNSNLSVSFGMSTQPDTKAYLVGTLFTQPSQLGLYITRENKAVTGSATADNDYMGNAWNRNVLCNGAQNTWTLNPQVNLSSDIADIYAYFPYAGDLVNPTQIPVSADYNDAKTSSSIDYMYATRSKASKTNPIVKIVMNHAQTRVRVYINKKDYSNNGDFTKSLGSQITFSAQITDLFKTGTMNINNGDITGIQKGTYEGDCLVPRIGEKGQGAMMVCDFMALPYDGKGNSDMKMVTEIDNILYTFNMPKNTKWERGKIYNYTFLLDGTSMKLPDVDKDGNPINPVVITDWIGENIDGGTLQ